MFLILFCLIFTIVIISPLLRTVSNSIFFVIFSLISVIIFFYFVFYIFDWCGNHAEGILSYKGMKLVMAASYEAKLQEFLEIIKNNISTIAGNNLQLKQYLISHPMSSHISRTELNNCGLNDIPALAKQKLQLMLNEYNNMLQIANNHQHKSSNNNTFFKVLIISGGIIVLGIIVYVAFNGLSMPALAGLNKLLQKP